MTETNLLRKILLTVSKRLPNVRLFRNNVGVGWAGKLVNISAIGVTAIQNARPLRAGLCEGSSDLIGWTSVEITPEMVGRRLAVFTAVEVKKPGGKATAEQLNFLQRVKDAGGIAVLGFDEEQTMGDIRRMGGG
jgi:hypothetical protein